MLVLHVYECLVEGYSLGQCTNKEARERMMNDFQMFQQLIAQQIPDPYPSQYNVVVTDYILAFNIPSNGIEAWLKKAMQDYTYKQLVQLVNSGPWDKKTKEVCHRILNNLNPK